MRFWVEMQFETATHSELLISLFSWSRSGTSVSIWILRRERGGKIRKGIFLVEDENCDVKYLWRWPQAIARGAPPSIQLDFPYRRWLYQFPARDQLFRLWTHINTYVYKVCRHLGYIKNECGLFNEYEKQERSVKYDCSFTERRTRLSQKIKLKIS